MQERPPWSVNRGHAGASAQIVEGWMELQGTAFGSHGKRPGTEQPRSVQRFTVSPLKFDSADIRRADGNFPSETQEKEACLSFMNGQDTRLISRKQGGGESAPL